jgi:transcription elongation factor GreB
VQVRDDAGDTFRYRIVGADETDAKTFAISIDSPRANALMKKRVNDRVAVTVGEKITYLNVLSIGYDLQ